MDPTGKRENKPLDCRCEMRMEKYSFAWMLLPFLVLLALASSMVIERSGVDYEIRYPPMEFLNQETFMGEESSAISHSQTLVLYDSEELVELEHFSTVLTTLDSMRVTYDIFDINSTEQYSLTNYEAVIVAFHKIYKFENQILELITWVESGGRCLFSLRPDPSDTFSAIYHKLGIRSKDENLGFLRGIKFVSDLLPGVKGFSFGTDFIIHNSYSVSLEEESHVYAVSADEYEIPLIWDQNLGEGRFVFINSNQFTSKNSRGILGATYCLLFDVFTYPVINASIFFIDDFPSPIPAIANDEITKQYGRDLQSFFVNVWWPDIKELSDRYNLYFTGVMIEIYNDQVNPPFEKQSDIEKHQYFGGLVLDNGGELGLHGYNHIPLCLDRENINQFLDYPGWPSAEAMELGVFELFSFAKSLFPDYEFVTYVPASNILCLQTRQWLPRVLPDLRVISSVYLEDGEGLAYGQEFIEAPDGIVELPRIIAGYEIDSYMWWAAVNELGLHYVNSHFVHPFDILNDDQAARKGWEYLRDKFEEYIHWLNDAAPGLRNMTAKEGAMAVQRFDRLTLNSRLRDQTYVIELDHFYDEAWLMLHAKSKPLYVDGGTISQVSSDFYLIKVLEPELSIEFLE
jgi:hypothetical protein